MIMLRHKDGTLEHSNIRFAAPAGVGAWVVPGGRRWTPNHTQTNRSIHCFATEEAIRGLRQAYVSQKKFDSQLPTHLGLIGVLQQRVRPKEHGA